MRIQIRDLSFGGFVASLRTEKMQLVSQARKLEGRLIQIEKNHDNFQREVTSTHPTALILTEHLWF